MPFPDLFAFEHLRPSSSFAPLDDIFEPDDRDHSAPADGIFFAILPSPAAAACMTRLAWHLRDKHRLAATPLRPRCLHISLRFAGHHGYMRPETLDALRDAAATIAMPRFRVGFDWVTSFRGTGKRPLVLCGVDGVGGLIELRDKLVAATIDIPGAVPSARHGFTPHVTLLYDERNVREEPVEEISWPVTEFVLVRSVFGESRHIPLGRWPLRG